MRMRPLRRCPSGMREGRPDGRTGLRVTCTAYAFVPRPTNAAQPAHLGTRLITPRNRTILSVHLRRTPRIRHVLCVQSRLETGGRDGSLPFAAPPSASRAMLGRRPGRTAALRFCLELFEIPVRGTAFLGFIVECTCLFSRPVLWECLCNRYQIRTRHIERSAVGALGIRIRVRCGLGRDGSVALDPADQLTLRREIDGLTCVIDMLYRSAMHLW